MPIHDFGLVMLRCIGKQDNAEIGTLYKDVILRVEL